ncbi:MAG: UDP-3-O-(3-hydroxymyristoyl)glucosamine N-acyltransferase [Planctomycetes bacterium]|nr:UDP-3-O-(3-hydroxymyristoyl)glucosamine N-acyltransferase [Planctomycetota bacterium]
MGFSVRNLAALVQGEVFGDADCTINGFAGAETATAGDITFASGERWRSALLASKVSAAILDSPLAGFRGVTIIVPNPNLAFASIVEHMLAAARPPAGVHERAVVEHGAIVDSTASVAALAFVGAGARIGPRTSVGPGAVIGAEAVIGTDCVIHARVVIEHHVQLGDRVTVQSGSVIGADGFGFATDAQGRHTKIPHTGTVIVGDDVEIGACACVDRARFDATRIGRGTKIDNLVQIAHNVQVGEDCLLAALVGIAGSTVLGDRSVFGGHVGIGGHLNIAANTQIAGYSATTTELDGPGQYMGIPAIPLAEGLRVRVLQARLPEMWRRLNAIEKRVTPEAEA